MQSLIPLMPKVEYNPEMPDERYNAKRTYYQLM